MDDRKSADRGHVSKDQGDPEAQGTQDVYADEPPQIVEVRMDYSKDVVQVARGSGCTWK